MSRSGENGIAIILALFMVMVVSVLGSSLMFVANTETLSTVNYRTTSQARYAAESAIAAAVNYLRYTYPAPASPGEVAAAGFTTTSAPVQYDNDDVLLATIVGNANYPDDAVTAAFSAATQGSLNVNNGFISYRAEARLLSMRLIPRPYAAPGQFMTLQTWEITGFGSNPGLGGAEVEVSAILETQAVPAFSYAAFATNGGCGALQFGGGATTNSYNSTDFSTSGALNMENSGGNVGTNGNLDGVGATTTINGTLSTPRAGVGQCTSNNVTAATLSGSATVTGGLVELPQAVSYPDPDPISPAPPTTNMRFRTNNGCDDSGIVAPQCVANNTAGQLGAIFTPNTPSSVIQLGDVDVTGGATLTLKAGTYEVNSIQLTGGSKIVVDSSAGPVVIKVAGLPNVNTPIDLTGGSITNSSLVPSNLQFIYGGTGWVRLSGSASASALVYAPKASSMFVGGGDFYGAVITGRLTDMGGADIHYDRALENSVLTAGNPTVSAFSWKSF